MSYTTVESGYRGKIVVATKDILPGELILEEDPIMFISDDSLKNYRESPLVALFIETFNYFMKKRNVEQQAKVLSLYGPTDCITCQNVREKLVPDILFSPDDRTPPRNLNPAEIEIFVKVNSVMRLNMFAADEGKVLYTEVTRFAHSCAANCGGDIVGTKMICRAIRLISAGEELTISYVGERDTEPTHERRHKYLERKEFTCHCSRCDAPGDDTRQFDCCDANCKGIMFACQPCNKKEILVTNLPYTGVEYVEPYLLPCTVCHRSAPAAYQAFVFALEGQLPSLAGGLAHMYKQLVDGSDTQDWEYLLREFRKIPTRHQLVQPVLQTVMQIRMLLLMRSVRSRDQGKIAKCVEEAKRAAEEILAAQEGIFPWAHSTTLLAFMTVVTKCIVVAPSLHLPAVFSPTEAKKLLQKTLRMWLVRKGRNSRMAPIDVTLLKTLETLPPLQSTDLCAFCEESPLHAALTLSRCSRCRQVAYCSAGCQKAHWKLHKKTCKAVA